MHITIESAPGTEFLTPFRGQSIHNAHLLCSCIWKSRFHRLMLSNRTRLIPPTLVVTPGRLPQAYVMSGRDGHDNGVHGSSLDGTTVQKSVNCRLGRPQVHTLFTHIACKHRLAGTDLKIAPGHVQRPYLQHVPYVRLLGPDFRSPLVDRFRQVGVYSGFGPD